MSESQPSVYQSLNPLSYSAELQETMNLNLVHSNTSLTQSQPNIESIDYHPQHLEDHSQCNSYYAIKHLEDNLGDSVINLVGGNNEGYTDSRKELTTYSSNELGQKSVPEEGYAKHTTTIQNEDAATSAPLDTNSWKNTPVNEDLTIPEPTYADSMVSEGSDLSYQENFCLSPDDCVMAIDFLGSHSSIESEKCSFTPPSISRTENSDGYIGRSLDDLLLCGRKFGSILVASTNNGHAVPFQLSKKLNCSQESLNLHCNTNEDISSSKIFIASKKLPPINICRSDNQSLTISANDTKSSGYITKDIPG